MKDWTKEWFTAGELLNMATDWDTQITYHDKVCPEKQIVILFGPEKSYKSSTALELALAMTCPPQNWYGIYVIEPMKVLYIFFEGEPGELKNKMQRAMVKYRNANLNHIIFKHFDVLELDKLSGKSQLEQVISALPWNPDIIFLDPWGSCVEDENKTTSFKVALNNIIPLGYRWIIVHHRTKPGPIPRTMGEMIRGSGVLGQRAHTLIGYFPNPVDEHEVTMRFKSRGPRAPDTTIKCDEAGVIKIVTPTGQPITLTQEQKAQVAIWNLLTTEIRKLVNPEKTVGELEAEIVAQLNISDRTVKKAWQKMVNLGIIKVRTEGKEKNLSISPFEGEPTFPL